MSSLILCHNCQKQIPHDATKCPFCESVIHVGEYVAAEFEEAPPAESHEYVTAEFEEPKPEAPPPVAVEPVRVAPVTAPLQPERPLRTVSIAPVTPRRSRLQKEKKSIRFWVYFVMGLGIVLAFLLYKK